ACPGKSPLPTGTAVLTRQPNWRKFAVSDCGCGMRLLRSELSAGELKQDHWNRIAKILRSNKGDLGDLGGGNHFLDAIESYDDQPLHFLIHTGSRDESGHVDALIDHPEQFDAVFDRVVGWAAQNRAAIHEAIASVIGQTELIMDLPHNTYELLDDDGAIIRKGSVRMQPGDLSVLPSHMTGDVVLVKALPAVDTVLNSMSHGTGRTMSRADCKPLADSYDFDAMRRMIMLPDGLQDSSLRTDGPYAYRDLDECLALIRDYVEVTNRFSVVAYMGHL
ncbi:MAG: RtcB family protein, partial [Fimbriimonadaceae bacterium]